MQPAPVQQAPPQQAAPVQAAPAEKKEEESWDKNLLNPNYSAKNCRHVYAYAKLLYVINIITIN